MFIVFALLFATGAIIPLVHRADPEIPDPTEVDSLSQGLWICVDFLCAGLLMVRWKTSLKAIYAEPLILMLLAISLISITWSEDPGLTLRRSLALGGATLVGVYFGSRFSLAQQLRLVAAALTMGALLSIGFALFLPSYGIHTGVHAGAWRGVYVQKNTLGRLMSVTLVALTLIRSRSRGEGAALWSVWFLTCVVLILTTSRSAILMACCMLAMIPIARALRLQRLIRGAVGVLLVTPVAVGGYLLWANREPVLDALGRDMSLTGRTDLWLAVIEAIKRKWLIGYGYGSFWALAAGSASRVAGQVGWDPAHAHNGYLDLWLELGLVGVAVYAAGFMVTYARSVRLGIGSRTRESLWPMIYLSFIALYNCVESSLLINNTFWILYVSVVVTLALSQHENRASAKDVREAEAKPFV